jgi:polysaccharide biosynthesis transport protein
MGVSQDLEKTEEVHLSDYWRVVKKRRNQVLTVLFLVVTATLVVSFLATPVYKASARLAIERESSASPVTGQRTEFTDVQSHMLTFNTHFQLIKSKPVLTELLQRLKQESGVVEAIQGGGSLLGQIREALVAIPAQMLTNTRRLLGMAEKELSPAELLEQQLEELQKKITISEITGTRLLAIDVEDNDPQMASRIANLLAAQYVEFDLASRLASDNQNLEWLNREVYALKKRLEDDEQKFFEYKQLHGVFSLTGKQKVIDQRITELNNEYLDTRNKRQELDAKLIEIEKQIGSATDFAHVRSILDNPSINDIYSSLTNLQLEQNRLAKVFGPKHPRMVQVASEISKVHSKLRSELSKEVENLRVQRTVLLNREKQMEGNINELEQDALDTSGKELTYTILQRNMDTSQQLYDTLVAKIKESGVASGGAVSTIRIVESATAPIYPFKPNKKRNLILGLILGLFSGVGLAFFLEYLDQTIRSEEDVQRLLGLPVLAVVPIAEQAEQGGYSDV